MSNSNICYICFVTNVYIRFGARNRFYEEPEMKKRKHYKFHLKWLIAWVALCRYWDRVYYTFRIWWESEKTFKIHCAEMFAWKKTKYCYLHRLSVVAKKCNIVSEINISIEWNLCHVIVLGTSIDSQGIVSQNLSSIKKYYSPKSGSRKWLRWTQECNWFVFGHFHSFQVIAGRHFRSNASDRLFFFFERLHRIYII